MIKNFREKIKKYFFPDMIIRSVADLDFAALKERGFRVILLDIDNTLVPHGTQLADKSAVKIIAGIEKEGLTAVVCSNAKANRLASFSASIQLDCISDARKPSPHAIRNYMIENNISSEEIILIGDQLITDILAARRAGIVAILSKPISKNEIFLVRLKRPLERLLIKIGGKEQFSALEEVNIDSL